MVLNSYSKVMKLKRSYLLAITAGLGIFMILYTVVRHFTGFSFGESFEKVFFDGIFIAAIGIFILNRKLAADERKEAESRKAEEISNAADSCLQDGEKAEDE